MSRLVLKQGVTPISKDNGQESKWLWLAFFLAFSHSPWKCKHRHHCCFPSNMSFCNLISESSVSTFTTTGTQRFAALFLLCHYIRHLPIAGVTSSLSCFQPETTWGSFQCCTALPALTLESQVDITSASCCVSSTA